MKVAVPLAKNVLAQGATSAIDAGIQKKTQFWNKNFNNFK